MHQPRSARQAWRRSGGLCKHLPKDAAHDRIGSAFGVQCDDGCWVELAPADAALLTRDLLGLRQSGQVMSHAVAIVRLVAQLATMR